MLFCDKDTRLKYLDTFKCPFNKNMPYSGWRFYGEDALSHFPAYKLEVLAPATVSTYKTAVRCGADAIYFGYGKFNARAGADNIEDFEEVVSFCHLHKVKAYLALNIMFKDKELTDLKQIIVDAENAKIDAFIISDLALLPLIRRYSDAEVHASTQMGIHNRAGAKFAAKMGFDRIILSREVKLEDIEDILNNVNISVEIFGHGALCAGFSGACLFSSMLTGKSGNRGRCLQLCRKEYDCIIDGKKSARGYLLSAKDICMASSIEEIKKLKISSIKIEGRLKSEDYIGGVTSVYSNICSGMPFETEQENTLKILFNRGNFTRGYWDNNDIIYKGMPNHIGLRCGSVVKRVSKNLVLIDSDRPIIKGDCFKVIRKGKEIGGLEATGETKLFNYEMVYVAYAPCDALENDEIYLTKTASVQGDQKKILVEIGIRIVAGERVHIVATCGGIRFEYFGEVVERAVTEPLNTVSLTAQFKRTKNTEFEFLVVNATTKNAFMTKKRINELRRTVIEFIEDKLVRDYHRPFPKRFVYPKEKTIETGDFIEMDSFKQFSPFVKENIRNIVYSPLNYDLKSCVSFYEKVKNPDNKVYIKFPIFIPAENINRAKEILNAFDGVVANDLGAFQMALDANKLVVAGWNLNVANSKNPILKMANQTVISPELNDKELKKFKNSLVYAFGRLPLMHLNFCPKKLSGLSCSECKKVRNVSYKDTKGEYKIITKKMGSYCQHELKNSKITNLGGLTDEHPRYFDFSGFPREEVENYLFKYFFGANCDTSGFNHLHLSRGVD